MVSVSCLPPTQYPGGDRWGVTVVTVLCADAGYTVCVQCAAAAGSQQCQGCVQDEQGAK